jgi:hypothetical protein
LRGGADGHSDDPIAEAGCEPLDLGDDRFGGVAREFVRHMRVRPEWVEVPDGPLRVGEVLLADQHEGPLGHASCMNVPFGGGELVVAAHDVNRARAVGRRVCPRDAAFDSEVHLECAWSLPEPAVGAGYPARQAVTEDACDGFGCQIEHRHIGGRQLRGRIDPRARFDLAAEVSQQCRQRIGDRL